MDTAELRQRLTEILDEEERANVDLKTVDELCWRLSEDLDKQPSPDCPHIVHHFLSDADIRRKDAEYGRGQRREIRRFADTGKCHDSKPVSGRGCLVVALAGLCAMLVCWQA